jgi:hypothetical protein
MEPVELDPLPVPLTKLCIAQIENKFMKTELYSQVHAKIKEAIETTDHEHVILPIESEALDIREEENVVSVTFNPQNRWHGVAYLLTHRDQLPVRLELMAIPGGLKGFTRDVGEGYSKSFFPPVTYYRQMPMIKQMLQNGKMKANLVVFLPRERSRYFATTGVVKVEPLDPDMLPDKEFCIPVPLSSR